MKGLLVLRPRRPLLRQTAWPGAEMGTIGERAPELGTSMPFSGKRLHCVSWWGAPTGLRGPQDYDDREDCR